MKKRRFTKDDWIALGLHELATHGCDAVKLEAICKAAGLTRGSFYHHFEDHEAFLTGLAEHWYTTQTEDVAKATDPETSADEQNAALTQAAMAIDYRLELGIRELARRLPQVHDVTKRADAMRLQVVSALYQQRYDLDKGLADQLAYIEYAAFSGIILLDPDIAPERQQGLADLYDGMMTRALKQERST